MGNVAAGTGTFVADTSAGMGNGIYIVGSTANAGVVAYDSALVGTTTTGYTLANGQTFIQPGLSAAEEATTIAHEGVHSVLSVADDAVLATARQSLRMWGYNNSALLNATEETIAETYATGSLSQGLAHAFNGAYTLANGSVVTPGLALGEAALGTTVIAGAGYGAYEAGGAIGNSIGNALYPSGNLGGGNGTCGQK